MVASRKQAKRDAETRERLTAMDSTLAELRERFDGLAGEIDALRRGPQSSGQYREAVELAQRGAEADVVAERCGISRAEADLIVALYRSQAA